MVPALVCSFRKTAARDGEGEEMLTYKEMCRESERTERESEGMKGVCMRTSSRRDKERRNRAEKKKKKEQMRWIFSHHRKLMV